MKPLAALLTFLILPRFLGIPLWEGFSLEILSGDLRVIDRHPRFGRDELRGSSDQGAMIEFHIAL